MATQGNNGIEDVVTALSALMNDENEALRRGDFAALSGMAAEKEALARQLEEAGDIGASARLTALRDVARRNAGLLKGAIGGVRAARLRLEELRRIAGGTATYDRAGRKSLHPAGQRQVERRA